MTHEVKVTAVMTITAMTAIVIRLVDFFSISKSQHFFRTLTAVVSCSLGLRSLLIQIGIIADVVAMDLQIADLFERT